MITEHKRNLRKYLSYTFDRMSFDPKIIPLETSQHAFHISRSIRGENRPPAIIIHGIMKRSGTVYVGELLSLHPHIYSYPNNIWEIPFLPRTGNIMKIQEEFFLDYNENVGKIGSYDFLPIFGSSFIHYLYSLVPDNKTMLLKMPGVQYLHRFFEVFPHENLLVLTRDGRDVVDSTVRTWPQISFLIACSRWNRSAKMILYCHKLFSTREDYSMERFEYAVNNPVNFVKKILKHYKINEDKFPFEKINSLKVIGSSTSENRKLWLKKTRDFNPIGRWRKWSVYRKSAFKLFAGRSLMDLGYCDNLKW